MSRFPLAQVAFRELQITFQKLDQNSLPQIIHHLHEREPQAISFPQDSGERLKLTQLPILAACIHSECSQAR